MPKIAGQIRSVTSFTKTLFIAALFSSLGCYAHACGVDSVAAKTDTTITITWNISDCNKLSASDTFEVCWKNTGDWNFPCGANRIPGYGESGTSTITGLSQASSYKIRTKWHHRSTGWHLVTNRVVTTEPSPSSNTVLRYMKVGHPQFFTTKDYCIDFYWKNPPAVTAGHTLVLHIMKKTVTYLDWKDLVVTNATFNSSTGEYTANQCGFYNSFRSKATVALQSAASNQLHTYGNDVEWK
jgi:hypothetical protein